MEADVLQDSYCRASHDFPGSEEGDLVFTTGDVLYVDRQIDGNWCHGKSLITGRTGIFPTNFVTKLPLPNMQLQTSASKKLFYARDRFIGQEQGDLSFLEGDIILGIRQVDENWWEGEVGSRRGIFPLTFVIELIPLTTSSSSIIQNGHNTSDRPAALSVAVSTSNELRAMVKHDLRPVDAQELELKAGETVIIEEFVDKFTCRGRTLDGRRGLFGKGFVEIVGQKSEVNLSTRPLTDHKDAARIHLDLAAKPVTQFDMKNDSISTEPISSTQSLKPNLSPKPVLSPHQRSPVSNVLSSMSKDGVSPYGRTKYKFEAEYPGELTFPAGIIIQLIRHVDDEWTEGILDGRRGIFPTSYVDIVVDCPRLQLNSNRMNSLDRKTIGTKAHEALVNLQLSVGEKSVTSFIDDQMINWNRNSMGLERHKQKVDEKPGIVKFDFMGTEDGDLNAFKGDSITLIRQINDEWLEARHNITGQIGVIPTSFVELPDESVVIWRSKKSQNKGGSNRNSASSLLDEKIAQNILHLGGDNRASSIRTQSQWSPSPALPVQKRQSVAIPTSITTPLPSVSTDPGISSVTLSSSPWLNQLVDFKSTIKPTVPQQLHRQHQEAPPKQEKRSTPPPRPAVPAALKMRNQTASQHLEMQRQQMKEQKKIEMRNQRTRIIQEILATETEYGRDLTLFRDTVLIKRNMLDADGLLGGSNWERIINLSSKVLVQLEEEFNKDFVYQEIGSCFLSLAEEFKEVYGAFCQSYEESQALLDKYETEPEKQVVLKDMLTKIQQSTTCIDLSTMLSRPVQRVLKYPLFLGELLKCTEDNQSDKVQLMKALKVMTEVAQIMNEAKRRKDLVTKYRGDGDMTFTERLSRFTLHSVRKKSTRFSMRLSSTIGLTQLAKDDQFEEAERQFRAVDRCCRSLLRDLQSYCEQIVVLFNYRMSIADALHNGIYNSGLGGTGGIQSSTSLVNNEKSQISSTFPVLTQLSARYLESWSKILLSESTLQKLFDAINSKVRQPLAHIQHSCKGPDKLISKRRDKLLDYESAAVKLEKTDNVDLAKINTMEEELRKAKAEYEAMNTQLLTELPQFNKLACEIITMAVRAFISAQRTFICEFGRCFEQTIGGGGNFTTTDRNVLETFHRKHRLATEHMGVLCFLSDGISGTAKSGALIKRQSSTVSAGSRASIVRSKPRPTITFPQKLQTEGERLYLRTQYTDKQLFTIIRSYEAKSELELTLKTGDLVGVIVDKDPMGSNERWFVDNGVTKGFVPQTVLKPLVCDAESNVASISQSSMTKALIDLNAASDHNGRSVVTNTNVCSTEPVAQQRKPTTTITRRESPVIFLPPEDKPASRNEGYMRTAARQSSINSMDNASKTADYASIDKKVTRRKAPSPPRTAQVNLQPVRPAPKPPTAISTAAGSVSLQKLEQERSSQEEETELVEFYVALYSFMASSENELSIMEGQILAVHDKKDLESNPEWWLVEDEDGSLGYVPGNYLIPYKENH